MPRLTDDRRRLRRTQIREAALRCFASKGFADTSMGDIVAESGLSAGSIYSHFDNKAELLRFAVEDILRLRLESVVGHLATVRAGLGPAELLDLLLDDAELMPPDRAPLLLQVWAQVPFDRELRSIADGAAMQLQTMLTEALLPWVLDRSGDRATAEAAAGTVLAAMHGFVVRVVLTPPDDIASLRASVVAGLAAITE